MPRSLMRARGNDLIEYPQKGERVMTAFHGACRWVMMSGLAFAVSTVAFLPRAAAQASTTTPGVVTQYATMNSIGVEWPVTGDANHNATVAVSYRVHGTTGWRSALPLVRMDYQASSTATPVNALNGSIFYLQPGVSYDVQLTLHDPDNGSDTVRTITQATRGIPTKPSGTVFHVRPDHARRDPIRVPLQDAGPARGARARCVEGQPQLCGG
ncbi:MAG TPA: hypothetical protein VLM79_15745 [Kofleriaceae bacterium]|nr:hypothetical protein [Kofleriaceae bacterium]